MLKTKSRDLKALFLLIALCLAVEVLGGLFTQSSVTTWYPSIAKPSWTPPSFVFGPVWTLLYLMMALAIWLIWKTPATPLRSRAYKLFGAELFVNFIWSPLFFGLHSPLYGMIDIILLWALLVPTILTFYQLRPLSAYLLLPYLIWTTYAGALNIAIWYLNRS